MRCNPAPGFELTFHDACRAELGSFGDRSAHNRWVKILATVLIIVGLGIVIWGAFGFQTRDKVLDVGPIHATKSTEHYVPYGPIAGAILAIGGVVLLVKGKA